MTKLKELRRACKDNVTQQDLAELLGTAQSFISKLENDEEAFKRIPMSKLKDIADLLGVEVSKFYE